MLGIGIVLPVFAPLLVSNATGLFDAGSTQEHRLFIYGLLTASYSLAQFFGAPVLGTYSDRYGRRIMLALSLSAAAIGYIIFALGVRQCDLGLLFLGRILAGFMGGNISIAYSAIADITTPDERPRYFAVIGAAFGLGFILGPFAGAVLSDPSFGLRDASLDLPFFAAAIFSGLATTFLLIRLPETLKEPAYRKVNIFTGFEYIREAFSHAHLAPIFSVVFLTTMGFSFFTQFVAAFLTVRFGFGQKDIGIVFFVIGIWSVITQAGLVRIISGKVSPVQIPKITLFTLATGIFLYTLPTQTWLLYMIIPMIAISQGLSYPNLNTIVSRSAGSADQGKLLGINQSFQAIGQAVPPLVSGYIAGISVNLPLQISAAIILLGWVIFLRVNKSFRVH